MKYDVGYELGASSFPDLDATRSHEVAARRVPTSTSEILASRSMSHELRTPLNAVIGLADLLLLDGGELSDHQREYVEGIAQSGRQLLALVNGVLDLARIEAGAVELQCEEVALALALNEAAAALEQAAQQRGVTIAIALERPDDSVMADRFRLRQLLCHLVSNAVKFTEHGGTVALRARREFGCIAIAVADTGIGIDVADLPRVFRAFGIEPPTADRPTGTGLGLTLTKRLVEMHGGTIEVVSERGVGTTFTVRFPVVE